MRVGVISYLMHSGADYRAAGVNVYTAKLLEHLVEGSAHEYLAFVSPHAHPPAGARSIAAPVRTDRAVARIAWEQTGLPLQATRARIDVLHGAVNALPALYRGPSVVTVHDLSFLRYPDRLPARRAAYLNVAVRSAVRRASRVIAVSENTKRDVVELLRLADERIAVVYPGVDVRFRPSNQGDKDEAHLGNRPYILHVGTLEPRKNLDVLIRAFAAVKRSGVPHALSLVGARGWMYDSLFQLVEDLGLQDDVRFVDYVAPADLPRWYNGADLFAYPSAYEGFGLPVLEAMACGTPVITSSSSSLAELAGDACLTVEPGSQDALERAIVSVLGDPALKDHLRLGGLARAAEFTWDRTARETVEVYETVRGEA